MLKSTKQNKRYLSVKTCYANVSISKLSFCEYEYICRVPEVDPYQSTIGTAMLYQNSIDFWYSYYLYQKSIDFWYSTTCTRSRSTFGTASSCTRSRSTFGTALIVPILDRLLGQPLSLYQSTIGTGLFSYLSPPY